uniref:Uncharacterized protein n=1 Tax=Arundo donax TaxID=35708 RepID=A0A0A9ATA1_ARUDO
MNNALLSHNRTSWTRFLVYLAPKFRPKQIKLQSSSSLNSISRELQIFAERNLATNTNICEHLVKIKHDTTIS